MKSKKVRLLSVLLSFCVSCTASVSAAEFSAGTESVEESFTNQEESTGGDVTDNDETEETFSDEENAFSDEETFDEVFSDESMPETEESGEVDYNLEAAMESSVTEADIPVNTNVKTTCTMYSGDNIESQNYSVYGSCLNSYLTAAPGGGLMRVQAEAIEGKVLVEYYDSNYNILSTVTVPLALPIFGAFYESGDSYYILTGQENTEQDNDKEVFHVTKYSKDWKVQGDCGLSDVHTIVPFNAGSARMVIDGNYLYVRTSRKMYKTVDGVNHQANYTFSINTSNMSLVNKDSGKVTGSGYISHSFNEFIQVDNGVLLGVDHGDANPTRAIAISRYKTDISQGAYFPKVLSNPCDTINIFSFPGESGNNYTGGSVGGFEYSSSSYLVAGNYDNSDLSGRNVFVASISKDGGTPQITYFSDYSGNDSASTPQFVKLGSDKFILLWSDQAKVNYTLIDGKGQRTGNIYSMAGNLSDCVPAVIDGKLAWYTWRDNKIVFYDINLSDLTQNHAVKIVNGHQYVYGEVKNGKVSRTCKICHNVFGDVYVPLSIDYVQYQAGSNKPWYKLYSSEKIEMKQGETYGIRWDIAFDQSYTYEAEVLNDCEISSSDDNIVSVKKSKGETAQFTAHKAGNVILTIKSKYNPSAMINIGVWVDMHELNRSMCKIITDPIYAIYNGQEQKPKVTVKLYQDSKILAEGTDYTISYDGDFVNANTYKILITGKGSYAGTVTESFTISKKEFEKSFITLPQATYEYNGSEQKPEFIVKDGNQKLVLDKDYTVHYANNVNPGIATAWICGEGNYEATSYRFQFRIVEAVKKKLENCKTSLSFYRCTYDGEKKQPTVVIKDGTKTLIQDTDYTISYENNVTVGSALVTVNGKGNYVGKLTKYYSIVPACINDATVTLSQNSYIYDGKAKRPEVTAVLGNKKLSSKDYALIYSNNRAAGTARVTLTGKGNYTGKTEKTFQIVKKTRKEISKDNVILSENSFVYDGTEKKPKVTVSCNNTKLIPERDYIITYTDNINAGTAVIEIKGTGDYTGTVIKNFRIMKAQTVLKVSNKSVTVDGQEIKIADYIVTDGTVRYRSSNPRIIKISGDKFVAQCPGKATITISVEKSKNYNSVPDKKITIMVYPPNVKNIILQSDEKGRLTISWASIKSIDGYQIKYSQSPDMKNAKVVSVKKNRQTLALNKLMSKKYYYVSARTYKNVEGKNYYSDWGRIKKIRIK